MKGLRADRALVPHLTLHTKHFQNGRLTSNVPFDTWSRSVPPGISYRHFEASLPPVRSNRLRQVPFLYHAADVKEQICGNG